MQKTFKVEPDWMRVYFNPVAGSDEKVILPLKNVHNKIKLSVDTIKVIGISQRENQEHPLYKDTDEFEIRIDGSSEK